MTTPTSPWNIPLFAPGDTIPSLEGVLNSISTGLNTALNTMALKGLPTYNSLSAVNAAYPAPAQGQLVFRSDLNVIHQYYAAYNATTNPYGWIVAGWYPPLSGMTMIKPQSTAGSGITVGTDGIIKLSGSSGFSLNGIFWGLFDEYVIEINLRGVTNTAPLVRLRAAGTDLTTASYQYQLLYGNGAAAGVKFVSGSSGTSWQINAGLSIDVTEGQMIIGYPADGAKVTSIRTHMSSTSSSGSDVLATVVGGGVSNVSAYDGLTFTPGAGVFNGTVKVYGRYKGGV